MNIPQFTAQASVYTTRNRYRSSDSQGKGLGLTSIVLQNDREFMHTYQSIGTPSTFVISSDGKIARSFAIRAEAIELLATHIAPVTTLIKPNALQPASNCSNDNAAARISDSSGALKIGEPAPEIKLLDLDGKKIDLADFRGNELVLLFWNPECGFCNRMLDDLKTWETNLPKDAPKLLLVSTGTIEANRSLGINSPILLDQDFATGSKFGAGGTPSAIRIDSKGNIASEVVAGAQSVLALIGT